MCNKTKIKSAGSIEISPEGHALARFPSTARRERYQEIFQHHPNTENRNSRQKIIAQGLGGQWSIILKISGVRQRRKRSAFAYEARTRQGVVVFYGCSSSAARSIPDVLLEGLREAAVTANRLQFNQNWF
ncbi:hypothetical protein SO802_010805 [Lithocarpus litseifolius]|uniref:Uncharacterized protein n=1 Tax=Lithocarpus litseifolius TaxID=425828 RepID=A0AAW2DF88_9ROSI